MKQISGLFAVAGLLLAAPLLTRAEDAPKAASESKSAAATPAASAPSLRKPGFVFMEFGTTHVEEYLTYFETVADFKLSSRQPGGYVVAQSERAELTFIDPKFWSNGHPFSGKLTGSGQGVGIEIGIVVADLDKAYAAAVTFKAGPSPRASSAAPGGCATSAFWRRTVITCGSRKGIEPKRRPFPHRRQVHCARSVDHYRGT
jgi:hypothetical protein